MFNIFKSKNNIIASNTELEPNNNIQTDVEVLDKPKQKTSNEIIQEIHDSYDGAVDEVLNWANDILANADTTDIKKGERLAKLGFINSIKAKVSETKIKEKLEAENKAKLISYYKFNYPFQKFITLDQVKQINKKYGLVCVTADCYKEDIPEKNLLEIEAFKIKNNSDLVFNVEVSDYKYEETFNFQTLQQVEDIKEKYRSGYNIKEKEEPLYISCPKSEAIIKTGYSYREDSTFVLKDEVKDPIVLKPVNGGFLIVSKWGLEASDELVINEIEN